MISSPGVKGRQSSEEPGARMRDCNFCIHYSGTSFREGWTEPVSEAQQEAPNQTVATADGLATSQPLALRWQWSALASGPDAGCSRGCGYADAPARLHEGRATHDGPRSCPLVPQSETRTASPTRQTTLGYLAQAGVSRACGRSPHSAPARHTQREG